MYAVRHLAHQRARVGELSAGLGVSVIPKVTRPAAIHPVRQIPLGKNARARQIAFVCRGADAETRRVIALRDAFVHSCAGGYLIEPSGSFSPWTRLA